MCLCVFGVSLFPCDSSQVHFWNPARIQKSKTPRNQISALLCMPQESTCQFPQQQNMDNRKSASSIRQEDWEVFSVVPNRELSAEYLISKGFLNIHLAYLENILSIGFKELHREFNLGTVWRMQEEDSPHASSDCTFGILNQVLYRTCVEIN